MWRGAESRERRAESSCPCDAFSKEETQSSRDTWYRLTLPQCKAIYPQGTLTAFFVINQHEL